MTIRADKFRFLRRPSEAPSTAAFQLQSLSVSDLFGRTFHDGTPPDPASLESKVASCIRMTLRSLRTDTMNHNKNALKQWHSQ